MSNINEDILQLIQSSTGDTTYTFNSELGDYIRLSLFTQDGDFVDYFYSGDGEEDITIYYDTNDVPYVKPNEVLDTNFVPQGNYTLQFDFYRDTIDEIINSYNVDDTDTDILEEAKYTITEISPSRKEVRIIVKSNDDTFNQEQFDYEIGGGTTFAEYLEDSFLSDSDGTNSPYQFHHVLNITRGRNILITNYTFDSTTNPNNTTLVLRLHSPLPDDVVNFNDIFINRELIQQQTQDIFYISNITSFVLGDALPPDIESFSDVTPNETQDDYQDFNDLYESGSFDENTSDIISASISNPDVNLNVDFNKFENHVFFGSAVSKLENFKTKVVEIEDYLTELSKSLNPSSGSNSSTHLGDRRKKLFNKIQNVKNNFTPYERFMYNDNQHTSTSSAPGIGTNLVSSMPVTMSTNQPNNAVLSNYQGFKTVYKHTSEGATAGKTIKMFSDKYYVQDAPFFNYSSSIYLSFLMRADEFIKGPDSSKGYIQWNNNNVYKDPEIPSNALSKVNLMNPAATGSEYRRHVYVASQSFWRPTSVVNYNVGNGDPEFNPSTAAHYEILSGSNITGSYLIKAPTNYVTYPSIYSGSVINENTEFNGSIMPMGELFRIIWSGSAASANPTSSFTTDIKITLKDPRNALPFSHLYSTGSTEWTNWYDGIYSSASAYDDDNIHSLKNNLPDYIREDSDSGDLKTFLHMIGEHFDLLRNYIDNYSSFYKRKYKTKESVPNNLLPILADNLGWEAINPFTGSLAEYFSNNSYDNNIQQIGESTWRKSLNNLIYIYKSKGTFNSVRALLNIYGYPADMLQVTEYGGSTEEHNPTIITSTPDALVEGLNSSKGNISFESEKQELFTINLRGTNKLNFDWWTNNANGDGIEFVFSSPKTTSDQILVESSGSGGETMWDISLVTSASDSTKGQLRFRLNNSLTGSLAIASNAVSMSTDYYNLKDTSLWNVMLQRMTSSLSSAITQSYQLSLGLQDEDKIKKFEIVSMSVHNPLTNVNFISGSSLDITSSAPVSGNLVFGETFSGSMSEIRNWSGSLSASKFKQHILNKFSTVGNDENGFKQRIWHYKLNENIKSGSANKLFKDANLNYFKNYSVSHSLTNNGALYNRRVIDVIKLVPRIDVNNQKNSNKIIVDPDETVLFNLNPTKKSEQTLYDKSTTKGRKRINTTKIDIVKSPTDPINKYITNNLADFDLTSKFGHPNTAKFSSSYKELDDLRDTLMENVTVDVNKYIEGQKRVFNTSIIKSIKNVLPGRSTLNSTGVSIKPDFLLRSKYKYHPVSIHTGSDAGVYEGTLLDYWTHIDASSTSSYVHNLSGSSFIQPYSSSHDIISNYFDFSQSSFIQPYSSSIDYVSTYIDFTQSAFIQPYTSSIDINNSYFDFSQSSFIQPYSSSIDYVDTYFDISQSSYEAPNDFIIYNIINDIISLSGSKLQLPYSSSIDYVDTHINFTQSAFIQPYTSSIDINNSYFNFTSSKLQLPYSSSINYVDTYINFTQSIYDSPYTSSFSIYGKYNNNLDVINLSQSSFIKPYSSSIDYVNTYINFTQSAFVQPYTSSIDIDDNYISLSSSQFIKPHSSSIDYVNTYINFTQSGYIVPYTSSIDIDDNYISLSSSQFIKPHSSSINYVDTYINFTESALILPYSGSINEVGIIPGQGLDLQGNAYPNAADGTTRSNLIDTWGTSSNHTHFLPYTKRTGAAGVYGDYNTAYHDSTFIIHTIGDREEVSGSLNKNTYEFSADFTNERNHMNRLIVDKGLGYTYKTYAGTGSGNNGAPVDGRPMGRTTYFSASTDTIFYPVNHYVNFPTSKQGIHNLTYGGSVMGEKVTTIKKDGSGDLIETVFEGQDPQYLVKGEEWHKLGWDTEFLQFISASSYAVYRRNVGGSDTENVLTVVRRS